MSDNQNSDPNHEDQFDDEIHESFIDDLDISDPLDDDESTSDSDVNLGDGTVALDEDDEFIDRLLNADRNADEGLGTVQFEDGESWTDADAGGLTHKRGSSQGSDFMDTNTLDSDSLGSSQMAKIWEQNVDSDVDPMMSFHFSTEDKRIDDNFILNPRIVTQGYEEQTPGTKIDYQLGKLLGKGAMGEVYLAKQLAVERRVALKRILNIDGFKSNKRRNIEERFLNEAKITADLDHPNIITLFDFGIDQNRNYFYCMEYIKGKEWSETIHKNTVEENLQILISICDGLAYSHSKGVIHRDIKPDNVMIGSYSQVIIMDWGLAVNLDAGKPGSIAGTPAYMAPEMAKSPRSKINKRSDVYLLGANLYQILTGNPPRKDHGPKNQSPEEVVQSIVKLALRNHIDPPGPLADESHRPLLNIALKAMSANQDDRFASVEQFKAELLAFTRTQQSVSQSVRLANDAKRALEEAQRANDYDKFSSALFGFRESLNLYPDNGVAKQGIEDSRIAYAQCALEQNDFELGLSLLDETNESDKLLVKQLKKQQRAVNSRQTWIRWMSIVGVALLALFTVYATYQNQQLSLATAKAEKERQTAVDAKEELQTANTTLAKTNDSLVEANRNLDRTRTKLQRAAQDADDARADALRDQKIAEDALADLKIKQEELDKTNSTLTSKNKQLQDKEVQLSKALKDANQQREIAETQKNEAKTQQGIAEMQTAEANRQKRLAERQSELAQSRLFGANLSLADSLIRDNQIAPAIDALEFAQKQANSDQFLDWEFNRLLHLCHRDVPERKFSQLADFSVGSENEIIIGTKTGRIEAWNWSTDQLTERFNLGEALKCLEVSSDGKYAALCSESGNFLLVDLSSQRTIADLTSELVSKSIVLLEFSPDNQTLVAGDANAFVYVWDVKEPSAGGTSKLTRIHSAPIVDVSFNGDGKLATVSGDGLCLRWDLSTKKLESAYKHPVSVQSVEFSRLRNSILACGDAQGEITFVDTTPTQANNFENWKSVKDVNELEIAKTSGKRKSLPAHASAVNTIRFSKDGKQFVTAGADRIIRVWNWSDLSEEKSLRGHDAAVESLGWIDGKSKFASLAASGTVRVWDIQEYEDQRLFQAPEFGSSEFVTFSRDGQLLATGNANGNLYVRDASNPNRAVELAFDENLGKQATLLPNSNRVVTSGTNRLDLWQGGTSVFSTERIGAAGHFAIAKDETTLLVGGDSATRSRPGNPTSLFNVSEQRVIAELLPAESRFKVTAVAISPDNQYAAIATGSTEGILFLFNISSRQKIAEVERHRGWISDLAFDRNNRLYSADSIEGYVNIWQLEAGTLTLTKKLDDVLGTYIRLDVDQETSRLVTASNFEDESKLKLFDTNDFQLLNQQSLSTGIRSVDFSKNGQITIIDAYGDQATWDTNSKADIKQEPIRIKGLKGRLVNGISSEGDRSITFGQGFAYVAQGRRIVETYGNISPCIGARFSDDNLRLVALYRDGMVRFWDLRSRKIIQTVSSTSDQPFIALEASLDADRVYIATKEILTVFDFEGSEQSQIDLKGEQVSSLCTASPDELVVGTSTGKVISLNLTTKAITELSQTSKGAIEQVLIRPGKILATVSRPTESDADGQVSLWRWVDNRWTSIPTDGAMATNITLNQTGNRLVTGNQAGILTIWKVPETVMQADEDEATRNALSLTQLISMSAGDARVNGISFGPSDRLLSSTDAEGSTVLWLTAGWED